MSTWAEEEIAEASRLWNDGFSAARIAEKLGRTRNMVVGIAMRNREMFPNRQPVVTVERKPWFGGGSRRQRQQKPIFPSQPLRIAVSNKQVIGSPRRFEQGFTTTFEGLQSFCEKHGFRLQTDKAWLTLRKEGQTGRATRLTRREAIVAIDNFIRIPAGLPPILGG
jgi:hypothetical protein